MRLRSRLRRLGLRLTVAVVCYATCVKILIAMSVTPWTMNDVALNSPRPMDALDQSASVPRLSLSAEETPATIVNPDNRTPVAFFPFKNQNTNDDLSTSDGISVIISVYQQPKCLRQMVQYFQTCDVVKEIRINWFDDPSMIQKLPKDYFFIYDNATNIFYNNTPIYFDVLPNKITHRFSPQRDPPLLSPATFHVDVDTLYTCDALAFAYQTWSQDYNSDPQVVVGFHPRFLRPQKYYAFTESYTKPFRHNTLFVTKGAILHSKWMNFFYKNTQYQKWRDRMDAHITAEDMLMSFFLAQYGVQTVPLCVNVHDTCSLSCAQGQQGSLAKRTGNIRPKLLQDLFQAFGDNILVSQQGSQSMKWSNETLELWNHRCYSVAPNQLSVASANRKCRWFCKYTPVCPENPRRRDPVDVWD